MDTHVSVVLLEGKVNVVVSESVDIHSVAVCNLLATGGKEFSYEIISHPFNEVTVQ